MKIVTAVQIASGVVCLIGLYKIYKIKTTDYTSRLTNFSNQIKKSYLGLSIIILFAILAAFYFTYKLLVSDDIDQYINLIALSFAIITLLVTMWLSLNNTESNFFNLKKESDANLILNLIESNYTLFSSDFTKLSKISDDIKKMSNKNEFIFYKLCLELKGLEYDSDFLQNQLNLLSQEGRSQNTFKKIAQSYFENPSDLNNIKPIAMHYLNEYRFTIFNGLEDRGLKKSVLVSGRDATIIFNKLKENNAWKKIDDLYNSNRFDTDTTELKYDKSFEICENLFSQHYEEVGHFFRHTHRIFKLINDIQYDDDMKNTYKGILRSQYPEKVLLAIYYNSVFTEKGLGLGLQLLKSDFFGDEIDFIDDQPIHFSTTKLLNKSNDLKILKYFFVSNSPYEKPLKLENKDFKKELKLKFDRA